MPVKNLTDRIQARMPRLGKLRKGGEKVNGGYGSDLDHFRFTSDREEVVDAFVEAYGETPRSIQVYLPYSTPQEAFPHWCELWNASGLVHRCDGEIMTLWLENGKYKSGTKPCAGGHEKNDPLNDLVGRMDVIIPELIEAGYVGFVTVETHSKNDVLSIWSTLLAVYDERASNPLGLRGILFNLRRVKENISIPGYGERKGQRARADKWLVKLEPAADWVRLQIEMAHAAQMNLLPPGGLPALNSGFADPVTGEILDGEARDATPALPASVETPKEEPKPAAPKNGSKPTDQARTDQHAPSEQKVAPKPAQGQNKPSEAPAETEAAPAMSPLADEINKLGEILYPFIWAEKKKQVAQNYNSDPAKVLAFLKQREQGIINNPDVYAGHVRANYPGFERLIPEVVKALGEKYDREMAILGIARAAKRSTEQPPLEDAALVNIVLADIPETKVPADFR